MAKKTIEELKAEAELFAKQVKENHRKSKLDEYADIIRYLRNDENLSIAKITEFLNKRAGARVSVSSVRKWIKDNLNDDGADEKHGSFNQDAFGIN